MAAAAPTRRSDRARSHNIPSRYAGHGMDDRCRPRRRPSGSRCEDATGEGPVARWGPISRSRQPKCSLGVIVRWAHIMDLTPGPIVVERRPGQAKLNCMRWQRRRRLAGPIARACVRRTRPRIWHRPHARSGPRTLSVMASEMSRARSRRTQSGRRGAAFPCHVARGGIVQLSSRV